MTEREASGSNQRCVAWCAALLTVAAMAPVAHAEGGLPGALGTAVDGPPPTATAKSTQHGGAPPMEPTAAESAGGAVFSPFGELSMSRASHQSQVPGDSSALANDHNFTLVVAAAGVAAIAWLLLKDV